MDLYEDKFYHATASSVIFITDLIYRVYKRRNPTIGEAMIFAARDALIIGVGKETADYLLKTDCELEDIIADITGISLTSTIFLASMCKAGHYKELMKEYTYFLTNRKKKLFTRL